MTIRPDAARRRAFALGLAALGPAAVLACARPAVAQTTTITFADIPAQMDGPRPFEGDRYAALGVLLSTPAAFGLRAVNDRAFPGPGIADPSTVNPETGESDPISIGAVSGADGVLRIDSPVIIDFLAPGSTGPGLTSFVSFFVADFADEAGGGQTYSAQAFDSAGNVLQTLQGTASATLLTFDRGGVFDIARVVFTPSGDGEGIDTLRFNTPFAPNAAAIPEPGTLALLPFAGLAAAAVRRRRRA